MKRGLLSRVCVCANLANTVEYFPLAFFLWFLSQNFFDFARDHVMRQLICAEVADERGRRQWFDFKDARVPKFPKGKRSCMPLFFYSALPWFLPRSEEIMGSVWRLMLIMGR